ncbi:MAG: PAS domain S-box protein [Chthoniobacterales bacterium]|nr:PAS domain S-box protein [Chthoniobacterales bacterium]
MVTALIASLVLFGWTFDVDLLKRILPALVAMNPMTAVAFLLAAISLALSSDEKTDDATFSGASLACALLIVLIGSAKIVAILGGPDLRVDQWLFPAKLSVGFLRPNVMAPNTALNFFLVGNALFLIHSKKRQLSPLACIAALVCGFEALLALLGYAYGIRAFYGMQSFIPMALPTAVAFLAVAFGIMACQARRGFLAVITGKNAGGMMARRLLPAAILVPAVIGWLRLEGQRMGFFDTEMGVALYTVTNMLVFGSLVACNAYLLFKTDAARARADQQLLGAHDELEAAVHSNQLIMDNSRDVICTIDAMGRFVTVSAACETLWGYKSIELMGKPYIDLVHPDDREKTNRVAAEITAGSAASDFENRYIRKDGAVIDVMWSAYWSEADKTMFCVAHDITERTRVSNSLKTAEAEANRANHAKSEFLSRMSHELRTPMNAILGFAQLLELDELSEQQHDGVGHILRGGRHLLELINEVLDISRIEAGGLSLSLEPVAIGEAIRETLSLVQPLASAREVRLNPGPDCSLFVQADRQRLKQVLINLLSNAIKYNRLGGSVTLSSKRSAPACAFRSPTLESAFPRSDSISFSCRSKDWGQSKAPWKGRVWD